MAVSDGSTPPQVGLAALLPFFRFCPTDEDLVAGFLSMKLGGGGGGAGTEESSSYSLWGDRRYNWFAYSDVFIPTVDLYGNDAYPWRVCQQLGYPYGVGSTEFYCYTPRRKKHENGGDCSSPDRSVGSSGIWSVNGCCDQHIHHRGVLVGHKVDLAFKITPPTTRTGAGHHGTSTTTCKKAEMVNTHWVMHEYRLERPGFQGLVLCRIRNQKKERDEARGRWRTPWWEEEQHVDGGGEGEKKRKADDPLNRVHDAAAAAVEPEEV